VEYFRDIVIPLFDMSMPVGLSGENMDKHQTAWTDSGLDSLAMFDFSVLPTHSTRPNRTYSSQRRSVQRRLQRQRQARKLDDTHQLLSSVANETELLRILQDPANQSYFPVLNSHLPMRESISGAIEESIASKKYSRVITPIVAMATEKQSLAQSCKTFPFLSRNQIRRIKRTGPKRLELLLKDSRHSRIRLPFQSAEEKILIRLWYRLNVA